MGKANDQVTRFYDLSDVSRNLHDDPARFRSDNGVAHLVFRLPGVVRCGIELGAGGVGSRLGLVVFLYRYGVYRDQFTQAQFIGESALVLSPGRLDARPGGIGLASIRSVSRHVWST
jgi:hypothetical protein